MINVRKVVAAGLLLSALAAAQGTPASQPQQPAQGQGTAAQPAQGRQGQTGQPVPAQGAQGAPAAGAPAAPAGKPRPEAQTQEELNAFIAIDQAPDAAAADAAAEAFTSKFPNSQLKTLALGRVMLKYQQANNRDKTIEAGRKVLASDANDPMALVLVATLIAEGTRETDLDRDEKVKEAISLATRALPAIDNNLLLPPEFTPEQTEGARQSLRAMAYSAAGSAEFARNNDAEAERQYKLAVQATPTQPDPVILYRLALVQDRMKKYTEALATAERAVALSANEPNVQQLARAEVERLRKLTAAPKPAAPASSATPAGAVAAGATAGTASPQGGASTGKPASPPATQQKPKPQTATKPPKS